MGGHGQDPKQTISCYDETGLGCDILWLLIIFAAENDDIAFDKKYEFIWGNDHILSLNQGRELQLTLDNRSGCKFASYLNYSSGFFHMRMKIPGNNNTAGVVTSFYLMSKASASQHDELDFEFLGNIEGQQITLQTNVFVNGVGDREQRINLWFDPAGNFHDYKIIWNPHQVVFFIDDTPIRVFKNYTNYGVPYPTQPMRIEAALWTADWATFGHKINWTYAPFVAHCQGFDISGCSAQNSDVEECYSSNHWWNNMEYWNLNSTQQKAYENVRKKYMNYDYCDDKAKYPSGLPRECVIQKNGRLHNGQKY
ncbi:hypothetical protein PS2_035238 [Malus domestica]